MQVLLFARGRERQRDNGLPVLGTTSDTNPARYQQRSAHLAGVKNAGEFSPLCLQLVRTGEASGSLDLMLENLAHHHRDNTLALADNLAALLEPALLVITGGIIGTLVVAMYLPIFHLGDAMSGMG